MIFSLQKRFLLGLLLPVSLVLVVTGVGSFFYARTYLLKQWESTARLQLRRVAHQIRMRLDEKRNLINLIAEAERVPNGTLTQAYLAQKLASQKGVRLVEIKTYDRNGKVSGLKHFPGKDKGAISSPAKRTSSGGKHDSMMCDNGREEEVCEIGDTVHDKMMWSHHRVRVFLDESRNFLTMGRTFGGQNGKPLRGIVVRVSFHSFIEGVLDTGRWEGSYACLVRSDGTYLAHTEPTMYSRRRLGEMGDPLEKKVLRQMKLKEMGAVFGRGRPPDRIMGFYKVPTTDWFLILSSPGSVVLAPLVRFRLHYGLAGLLSLVVIGLLIRWNTKPVAASVAEISEAAAKVEDGDYNISVQEDRSDEIGRLKQRFNKMIQGLKQRELMERTFGRYMDKGIAKELMNKPEALRLGGKNHTVTILMADLRGFTKLSERLQPEEVICIVNRHFAAMIEVIERHRGIIVDFFGDSVLVFFNGIELDVRARAADAVRCAVEMQEELERVSKLNEEEGLPPLKMGVGVHTGEVVIGNIGSESRAKYGIVGSPVNETHRIQSFAEGGAVIISEQTLRLLKDRVRVGPRLRTSLKGLEGDRDLYSVISIDGKRPPGAPAEDSAES